MKTIAMNLRYYIGLVLIAGASVSANAALGAMRDRAVAELEPYCQRGGGAVIPDVEMMPDGKTYVESDAAGRTLTIREISTGKEVSTLFDVTHTRQESISHFEGYILSPDASKVLVWCNTQKRYRRSSTAEYYVYEVRSRLLKPLSTTHKRQSVPMFSPDSRMVAFEADADIYLAKLDYGTEVPVTTDGSYGTVINGATDWTYEEEFGTTSLMSFAPDNLTLCYVRFDESRVPVYTLPIYAGTCHADEQYEYYPGVFSYKYPVAGRENSTVSVHSYDVETRKTKEVELPGNTGYYIPSIEYGPKATQLMVSTLNRDQNRFELFLVNPKSTVSRSVYVDESKAWIEEQCYTTLSFGESSFVVASDTDGWMRYYEYSYAGAKLRDISAPGVDATAYHGQDALGNHYYTAAAPTPMDRTVYRADRKGTVTAVSPTEGTSQATFNADCSAMLLFHSSVKEAPRYTLCRADGKEYRVLEDNKALSQRAASLQAQREFIKIAGENGLEFNAYIVKPRDFDATRRYPVIMSQYSGPGSQEVLNRWTLSWEDYFASRGYIIICMDGRGTGGRGAAFRTAVYRQLGKYETIDQLTAARYAASLPYADASRIGIYGWSYGGYEALMCASADQASPYAAAVAIAPVTDWRYYDTVYTERFMLTPQQNAAGYTAASALGRALHLNCPLLMMYGTADDNVHPANTLQYVSTLQSAGILCDMFVFPQMNHSINGCNARQVVYAKMLSYFNNYLK